MCRFESSVCTLLISKSITIFAGTNITAYSNAHFGESRGPYHLDNVNCNGYETNLLGCSRQYPIGVHNCEPWKEVGVKCDGMCMDCNFRTLTKQLLCAMKLSLGVLQQGFMPEMVSCLLLSHYNCTFFGCLLCSINMQPR